MDFVRDVWSLSRAPTGVCRGQLARRLVMGIAALNLRGRAHRAGCVHLVARMQSGSGLMAATNAPDFIRTTGLQAPRPCMRSGQSPRNSCTGQRVHCPIEGKPSSPDRPIPPSDRRSSRGRVIGVVRLYCAAFKPAGRGFDPNMTSHALCVACWFLTRREALEDEARR